MAGLVKKQFFGPSAWICPAGVTSIQALATPAFPVTNGGPGGSTLATVSSNGFALFTNQAGSLFGIGNNANGQLGNGTVTPASSPIAVSGSLKFTQVVNDGASALGITSAGTAYMWGINTSGQLGNGTVTPMSTPTAVLGGLTFVSIFADTGNNGTFGGLTSSGALYMWGSNAHGQLGNGTTTPASSPVAVLGGLSFVQAGVGMTSWGLTSTGALYTWGSNNFGQLGQNVAGSSSSAISSPVAVVGGLTFSMVSFSPNNSFFSALTSTGAAYAWGNNAQGQCGTGVNPGTTAAYSSPVAVAGGLTFAQIQADVEVGQVVLALTPSGVAYGWGNNNSSQLGQGSGGSTAYSSPVAVLGGLVFSSIYINANTAFGITSNGATYAWGANNGTFGGPCGVNSVASVQSPTAISGGYTFVEILQAGSSNAPTNFGVTPQGALYSWGINSNGIAGNGNLPTTKRSSPTAVVGGLMFAVSQNPANINTLNQNSYIIPVTPGATYNIVCGATTSSFGGYVLGFGPMDNITITYEQ